MAETKMTVEEAIARYGFNPEHMGNRHRDWWVEDETQVDYDIGEILAGTLIVYARDGAANPPDPNCFRQPNYIDTWQSSGDPTYRLYAFSPLATSEAAGDE